MNNFYARLFLVILIVIALSEAIPEIINYLLVLVLIGMLLMRSATFAKLIASLKL